MLGNDAYARFDTALLRMSAGWRGDFIWLMTMAQVSAVKATAAAGSAPQGAQLYQRMGCAGCHSIDGSQEGRAGPTFKGSMDPCVGWRGWKTPCL